MELTNVPKTFRELRQFYVEVFSPLYDRFIISGAVAQELHAEMAAAFDHLICRASDPLCETPEEEIRKAAGHLKRATFDGFKLIFEREIRKPYDKLMDIRYADVHDGKFRKEITEKWVEAKSYADSARAMERRSRGAYEENWHLAFDEWKKILPIADHFNALLKDETVIRAHRSSRRQCFVKVVIWAATLLIGALLGLLTQVAYSKFAMQ